MTQQALWYRDAGVDLDAGDQLVERIKPFASDAGWNAVRQFHRMNQRDDAMRASGALHGERV